MTEPISLTYRACVSGVWYVATSWGRLADGAILARLERDPDQHGDPLTVADAAGAMTWTAREARRAALREATNPRGRFPRSRTVRISLSDNALTALIAIIGAVLVIVGAATLVDQTDSHPDTALVLHDLADRLRSAAAS